MLQHLSKMYQLQETSKKYWHILCRRLSTLRERRALAKETPIFNLPIEIFGRVFSHLPSSSKACVALSCKGLYQVYRSVLADEELRFPRLSLNEGPYIKTEAYHQRMTLLTQLEDKSWACCGRCQMLHRREEFPSREIQSYPLDKRACSPWAGILDLCPCIALTIRDILEYLSGTETARIDSGLRLVDKGFFEDSFDEKSERSLSHKCKAYYPSVGVTFMLSLPQGGHLLVNSGMKHSVTNSINIWDQCISVRMRPCWAA